MELDCMSTPEVMTGEIGGYNNDTILAISNLVSNGESNGEVSTITTPQELYATTTREHKEHAQEKSTLDTISLASKQACVETAGLIPAAKSLILGNVCALRTDKHYA
ncbi:hypothetical protein BGZ76_004677, partial [Entomortierella beljakovae]